ncbi:MAG: TetR/AcrR family transcriptional regulator [Bacillota bacterium]|nr:TetR/AcrR family transcriptional regulator [Bacillota bacterium]
MAYSKGTKLEDEISEEIIAVATQIAYTDGVGHISVKRILSELGVTNRVFYNRFRNLDDVLVVVYDRIMNQMRECISQGYDESKDYFEYLIDLAVTVLRKTYEDKLHFSHYMFEYDSYKDSNRNWWIDHMIPIFDYGIEKGLLRKMDTRLLGYSIWCFLRGFNADAVGGGLTFEEALDSFKLGINCFLEGMKKR